MVNVGLLSHPVNWITLAVWVFLIGMVIHFVSPMIPTSTAPQG